MWRGGFYIRRQWVCVFLSKRFCAESDDVVIREILDLLYSSGDKITYLPSHFDLLRNKTNFELYLCLVDLFYCLFIFLYRSF